MSWRRPVGVQSRSRHGFWWTRRMVPERRGSGGRAMRVTTMLKRLRQWVGCGSPSHRWSVALP